MLVFIEWPIMCPVVTGAERWIYTCEYKWILVLTCVYFVYIIYHIPIKMTCESWSSERERVYSFWAAVCKASNKHKILCNITSLYEV